MGARLGFHAGDFPGLAQDAIEQEMRVDKEYFENRGVNAAFLEKAFGVPSETMWYPTMEELILDGVVTHVYDGSEVVRAVLAPDTTLEFDPQTGRFTPGR